ncbi:GNAT family N-acetyltransferase [Sporolactobacillus kofuensis]|uniref:GNAT family N-acetyltransferase n=1 Tax=Sporolactobacillus kofuensis TaxID=269672 RepID=A0ABW1WFZ8_9BACL|nr:GNAT family N-acetyltransferase [Sporolactobacillus kofuensis]MCO7175747.1 GNAT family N-acetyltransferase [Sporolactobacillus kofuensis]
MILRHVRQEDLKQLVGLENTGFTPEEAATENAFINRIATIPDTFIIAEEAQKIIGYVNGPVISVPFITDDLFNTTLPNPEKGGHQSILGILVDPNHQRKGIACLLLKALEKEAKKNERLTVTLTCREALIPFYEKNGYTNQGIAESQHGGIKWFTMTKQL